MKVILDARATALHMLFRGKDPLADVDPEASSEGRTVTINRVSYALENWMEEYLMPWLGKVSPRDIILCWDGGREYRTAIYPEYKANRDKAKNRTDLWNQRAKEMETAVKLITASLGIINVSVKGVEGDDIVAHVCKTHPKEGKAIITIDGDLSQLVDPYTAVYYPDFTVSDGDTYKDIPTDLLQLNKSLVGDTSDNYKGVPKFGPKTWERLLQKYGHKGMKQIEANVASNQYQSLQAAYDATEDKDLKLILDNTKAWRLSYRLAGLYPHLCYSAKSKGTVSPVYYVRLPFFDRVRELLSRYDCTQYMEELEELCYKQHPVTIDTVSTAVSELKVAANESEVVAFDFETFDAVKHQGYPKDDHVDVINSEVAGVSFCAGKNDNEVWYFPVEHRETDNCELSTVKTILESYEYSLVAHNSSFEGAVSSLCLDLTLNRLEDTQIMMSYVDENERQGLKASANRFFGYEQMGYDTLLSLTDAKDMRDLTLEDVLSYGCDDSLVTAHLRRIAKFIMTMEGSWKFYKDNETYVVPELTRGFLEGTRLDSERLEFLRDKDQKVYEKSISRIRELLSKHCNSLPVSYPKNLSDELANRRKLFKEEGHKGDKVTAKVEELKIKWQEACVYRPYQESTVKQEFLPTPKNLKLLLEHFALPSEELTAVNRSRINNWASGIDRMTISTEQEELVDLICAAAGDFAPSRRTGDAYCDFMDFVQPIWDELNPPTKKISGDELNLNSPAQMLELFYCKLGLPVRMQTFPKFGQRRYKLGLEGSPATDDSAMSAALAFDCEEGDWRREVLQCVKAAKKFLTRRGLFYDPYPKWVNPTTDMLHGAIRDCGTVTRRPSGSSPNFLQWEKGEIRTFIIPRYTDHIIISPDFSGQELRIAASESKDPTMIGCYTRKETWTDDYGAVHPVVDDVHSITSSGFAQVMFERQFGKDKWYEMTKGNPTIDYDTFTILAKGSPQLAAEIVPSHEDVVQAFAGKIRGMAKVVNFLLIYGGTAFSLALKLQISEELAEILLQKVFGTYKRLQPWQKETVELARKQGYIETAFGNRMHIPAALFSDNGSQRNRVERQLVNFTIQGTAADILKRVLAEANKTRLMDETGAILIAPVYDELMASVPMSSAYEYCERLQDIMNITPPGHAVPMLSEVKLGLNAGVMVELGDRPSEKQIEDTIETLVKSKEAA